MKPGTLLKAKKHLSFTKSKDPSFSGKEINPGEHILFVELERRYKEQQGYYDYLWFLAPDGTKMYFATSDAEQFWEVNFSANNFEEVIL